jgi:quercetin dioxygenase-like cupin family protein
MLLILFVVPVLGACGATDSEGELLVQASAPQVAAASDDQYRRVLEQSVIAAPSGDLEVLVREHVYPPGWAAPTHYHDGDLFIYVSDGEFEVATEEGGTVRYSSGDVVRMHAETIPVDSATTPRYQKPTGSR